MDATDYLIAERRPEMRCGVISGQYQGASTIASVAKFFSFKKNSTTHNTAGYARRVRHYTRENGSAPRFRVEWALELGLTGVLWWMSCALFLPVAP